MYKSYRLLSHFQLLSTVPLQRDRALQKLKNQTKRLDIQCNKPPSQLLTACTKILPLRKHENVPRDMPYKSLPFISHFQLLSTVLSQREESAQSNLKNKHKETDLLSIIIPPYYFIIQPYYYREKVLRQTIIQTRRDMLSYIHVYILKQHLKLLGKCR